jgi:hypothetical protein
MCWFVTMTLVKPTIQSAIFQTIFSLLPLNGILSSGEHYIFCYSNPCFKVLLQYQVTGDKAFKCLSRWPATWLWNELCFIYITGDVASKLLQLISLFLNERCCQRKREQLMVSLIWHLPTCTHPCTIYWQCQRSCSQVLNIRMCCLPKHMLRPTTCEPCFPTVWPHSIGIMSAYTVVNCCQGSVTDTPESIQPVLPVPSISSDWDVELSIVIFLWQQVGWFVAAGKLY